MAQVHARYVEMGDAAASARYRAIQSRGPAYQAYLVLSFAVVVVPIIAYVVSAWLLGIIVNLLLIRGHYDIAPRDLGLALAAFALGRLAQLFRHA